MNHKANIGGKVYYEVSKLVRGNIANRMGDMTNVCSRTPVTSKLWCAVVNNMDHVKRNVTINATNTKTWEA